MQITIIILLIGSSTFFTCVLNLEFVPLEKYDKSLQIETKNGYIQGLRLKTKHGTTYRSFLGIPYAKPPIGNLRFKAPRELSDQWNGVLNATYESPACAQIKIRMTIKIFGEEDCLHLNIFTPELKTRNRRNNLLPVLIWVYGGAFQDGRASITRFCPDALMDQGVILVHFNYRVGVFGFLSTSDLESPGNYGLKDQQAVFKWVKSNIKNFNGDPNRITIFGESAGAASVAYHLMSPKNEGLFHGAILQSGTSLAPWSYQKNPRKVAFDIGLKLGIETSNSKYLLKRMREFTTYEILEASFLPLIVNILQALTNGLPFTPTVEPLHSEAFISNLTFDLLKNGKFLKIPIIAGVTSKEAGYFEPLFQYFQPGVFLYDVSPSSLTRMNIRRSQDRTEVGKKILSYFFKDKAFISASKDELLEYLSDDFYRRPLIKTISFLYKHIPVYLYVFSYQGAPGFNGLRMEFLQGTPDYRQFDGVTHTEENYYIFQNYSTNLNSSDDATVTRMTKLWSNFAKTGNPTPIMDKDLSNIIWPKVTTTNNIQYLDIGQNLVIKSNFYEQNYNFWKSLYENYTMEPYIYY